MNILIVEDENISAQQLKKLILKYDSEIKIIGVTESIRETVDFLETNKPDLIFLDIQLADGLSFDVFKKVNITIPVIFTTAFDKYAIESFQLNSIEYLLKPITFESVSKAFEKYEKIKSAFSGSIASEKIMNLIKELEIRNTKERFLVKLGNKMIPVESTEILYFFAEDKWTYIITKANKKYLINYNLSQLEELIDRKKFIRLNRQYIVPRESILSLENYFKGQVVVKVKTLENEKIVVSRQQTPSLKKWMEE